ncbi:hypothetical protein C0993_006452, partial [Termitomyces sp. T159_Od127]
KIFNFQRGKGVYSQQSQSVEYPDRLTNSWPCVLKLIKPKNTTNTPGQMHLGPIIQAL